MPLQPQREDLSARPVGARQADAESVKPVVLLVDDDELILRVLVRTLRNQPYRLHTAKSAEEAMWILKAHDVAVVVSDECMPGMSGSDFLAWVAEKCPEVVRIVLTACPTADQAIRAINEGRVFRFFTKPCDEVELALSIRKAIDQHAQLRAGRQIEQQQQQKLHEIESFSQHLRELGRSISREVQLPLEQVNRSCRTLLESHPELFDPQAVQLLDSAMEAVGEARKRATKLLDEAVHSAPAAG